MGRQMSEMSALRLYSGANSSQWVPTAEDNCKMLKPGDNRVVVNTGVNCVIELPARTGASDEPYCITADCCVGGARIDIKDHESGTILASLNTNKQFVILMSTYFDWVSLHSTKLT